MAVGRGGRLRAAGQEPGCGVCRMSEPCLGWAVTTGRAAPRTGGHSRAASAQGSLTGSFLLCSPTDKLSCCLSLLETAAQMCCRCGKFGLALEQTAQLCSSSPVSRGIPGTGMEQLELLQLRAWGRGSMPGRAALRSGDPAGIIQRSLRRSHG